MGTTDEHWCSVCKRDLDKKKDKYVEFELVNEPSVVSEKKPKKPKGIICQKCIDENPKLKKAIELMVKAGNPNFVVAIQCLSKGQCENFKKSKAGVNCAHIAVLGDEIYCKRSHPGVVKLPQEKAEVERYIRVLLTKYLRTLIRDPALKKVIDVEKFDEQLKTIFHSASSIVQKQHEELPKQP